MLAEEEALAKKKAKETEARKIEEQAAGIAKMKREEEEA
jgi:hypothetical protein